MLVGLVGQEPVEFSGTRLFMASFHLCSGCWTDRRGAGCERKCRWLAQAWNGRCPRE